MSDELLDIVNAHDKVIWQKYRSEIYAQKWSNFRVINAFLINNNNQVWIPKRSASKKLFPLCWDASVGGHVSAGESYDEAFARELQEELNIELAQVRHEFLGRLTPNYHAVSAFMKLYCIRTNSDPNYNTDDFCEAAWFSIDDIQEKLRQGAPTKNDLPKLLVVVKQYLASLV